MDSATPPRKSLLQRAFDDVTAVGGGVDVEEDPIRVRLLDAAYDQFRRMGIQRTSLEEVARRAGTSRVTLYRKFTNKDILVEEVMLREFRRYLVQFLADVAPARTAADRLVAGFLSAYRAVTTNPLIIGLLEVEPSVLAGLIGGDDGRLLTAVRIFVAAQLREEQQAGNLRGDLDVDLTAEMLARISVSFVVIPSHIIDLSDDDQLVDVARRYLVPMLDAPPPTTG
ncbi:TetR/AcrR family transcriptional regulator [Gordonia sp. VNQ95]|jgi:AcrR family transcriptional regulator|uniref:TetR/AcrR family transcriptional regulator n=1 Tax=Gordonia TaxID=2053 RepID=UPI0032B59034